MKEIFFYFNKENFIIVIYLLYQPYLLYNIMVLVDIFIGNLDLIVEYNQYISFNKKYLKIITNCRIAVIMYRLNYGCIENNLRYKS